LLHEFYDPLNNDWESLNGAGIDLAVRASLMVMKFVGVEGELNFIPISGDNDVSASILGFRAHVIGQLPMRVTPFGILGFGGMKSSSDELGDDTDGITYLGVGVKAYVTDSVVLRAEGRLIRAPKRELDPDGVGTNHGEVLVGLSYQLGGGAEEAEPEPEPDPDPDGDGIVGAADSCPTEAGVEPDGCPVRDSDGDGINDPDDKCPQEPETKNGFADDDGCPDEIPDTDGDGFKDPDDKCVDQAEDKDGFEDDDGCPEDDNDQDGVVDGSDQCPLEAGPVENNGCPDTDTDGDGVVDRLDNCPTEVGTPERFGCKKKQLVQITKTALKIMDKVYFRTNRARIRRRSRPLLDNIAAVLEAHQEIKKVRIEGHTDSRGDAEHNRELSEKRANAVRDYLIKKGVDADRLEAVGFGMDNPVADNESKAGREKNRRVEFNIVGE
jgi:outer membrane protein OmpA-like peptidoglycan-associated protein